MTYIFANILATKLLVKVTLYYVLTVITVMGGSWDIFLCCIKLPVLPRQLVDGGKAEVSPSRRHGMDKSGMIQVPIFRQSGAHLVN